MHPTVLVRRTSLPVVLAATAVLCASFTGTAHADVNPGEIASGMQDNGGLYVDPESRYLTTDAQLDAVRRTLEKARLPVRIAVLPAGAIEDDPKVVNRLIIDIYKNTQRQATYAVIVGDDLRTYSWTLTPARTQQLTKQALKAGQGNMNSVILNLARLAGNSAPGKPGRGPVAAPSPTAEPATDETAPEAAPAAESGTGESAPWPLIIGAGAVVLLGAGGGFFLLRSRKKKAGTTPAGVPQAGSPQPGGPQAGVPQAGAPEAGAAPVGTPQPPSGQAPPTQNP